jgi:hypothetical protein
MTCGSVRQLHPQAHARAPADLRYKDVTVPGLFGKDGVQSISTELLGVQLSQLPITVDRIMVLEYEVVRQFQHRLVRLLCRSLRDFANVWRKRTGAPNSIAHHNCASQGLSCSPGPPSGLSVGGSNSVSSLQMLPWRNTWALRKHSA